HLQKTNNNMKLLHQNDVPARTPSKNCKMFSISSCLIEELKEIYEPVYQKLLTTPLYEYIKLNSFAS
ncbi:6334_t:CDS:1, partial [Funneliformis geosporum]